MTVQRILNTQDGGPPEHIDPDAGIDELLNSLAFQNVGALVVSGDGRAVEGIISERDIVRGLQELGPNLLKRRVRDVMTRDVKTCVAEDRAIGIMAMMVSRHLRHVPVVKDGEFVNMVSIRDVLKLRLQDVQSEAEAMRSYINGGLCVSVNAEDAVPPDEAKVA